MNLKSYHIAEPSEILYNGIEILFHLIYHIDECN